jgi:hypothetical protein
VLTGNGSQWIAVSREPALGIVRTPESSACFAVSVHSSTGFVPNIRGSRITLLLNRHMDEDGGISAEASIGANHRY